jgi:glucose-6-phosphate isomerase
MVLVLCGRSYLRPHRHPANKNESYHVLEGELAVYLFDDEGQVTRTIELGAAHTGRPFLYRLCAPLWHMPVPHSPVVVYHEVMTGPFDKDRDVEYASWSPEEGNEKAVEAFLRTCGATGRPFGAGA